MSQKKIAYGRGAMRKLSKFGPMFRHFEGLGCFRQAESLDY